MNHIVYSKLKNQKCFKFVALGYDMAFNCFSGNSCGIFLTGESLTDEWIECALFKTSYKNGVGEGEFSGDGGNKYTTFYLSPIGEVE